MSLRLFPAVALVMALFAGAARGQSPVIATTFGPNYTYGYPNESRRVAADAYLAMPFVASVTAPLNRVVVPVYNVTTPNEIRFTLTTDSNGLPGATLETWLLTNLVFGALTTNESVHFPVLTNGLQYWLVASADNPTTQSLWWLGPLDGSIPADNLQSADQGATWIQTTATDCAYEIDAENPAFASLALTETNVSLNVLNGLRGHTYVLISATSMGGSLSTWKTLATNQITANGPFTVSAALPVNTNSTSASFYALKMR